MIRINLLPQRKSARRGESVAGGQAWVFFVLGALVFEILVLVFVYGAQKSKLADISRKNTELKDNIAAIDREMSNHSEIKTQLKELRDREDAIQKLQSARTGPTGTLLELSRIMSPGRGPTVADKEKLEQMKRDNPLAVPNPNWDTKRLWLTHYTETNREVKIQGTARDGEDVSEFLRRLSVSDYFYDVRLMPATKSIDPVTKLELVKFEMAAKVRY